MSRRSPSAADLALLDAARRGDADGVRAALATGAAPEARDDDGRTPLLRAALADRVAAAEVLVAAGADVNAPDARRDTARRDTGTTGSVPCCPAARTWP